MPDPIMKYFDYHHLPEGLPKLASFKVWELAQHMDSILPESAEKSAGMRKLLEAKDCFVRTALEKK